MIKTPLSTVIGGAFWTPKATVIGGQQSFSQLIKKLFANNEQGFFYDPNDLSTMFQDSAGTVPVTDAGQSVGLILDKSGRNNHAFQNNSASRPILRKNAATGANYLEFDGADDSLHTNIINYNSADKLSLFAGARKFGSRAEVLVESSANANNFVGAFYVSHDSSRMVSLIRGSANNSFLIAEGIIPPSTFVTTIKSDLAGSLHTFSVNGTVRATSNTNLGANSKLTDHPLNICRRPNTNYPFNGHVYGLIGIGKLVSDDETLAIEKEIAKRVGVTL